MKGKLNIFKVFFSLIIAASLLAFNAGYDNADDIDRIESELIKISDVPVTLSNLNTMPIITQTVMPGIQTPLSLLDTFTIMANPGPANNGGSTGWAIFFDLIGGPLDVEVTQMSSANSGAANASFSVEIFTREGTALGGPVGSGPGSSPTGWTSLGSVPAVQGPTANGISLIFTIPNILVPAGDTVGVAAKFTGVGPRYYGTGTPPYSVYSDSNLTLITGDVRSVPFTTTGTWFASRALTGEIRYIISPITGISNNNQVPEGFTLSQNYPNPFNPTTTIHYALPKSGNVTLTVFDITGREVARLVKGEFKQAGSYNVSFDASHLASGMYLYRIESESFIETKKMVLIK